MFSRGTTLIPANSRRSFQYGMETQAYTGTRVTEGEVGFPTCVELSGRSSGGIFVLCRRPGSHQPGFAFGR
jgi:hypothetical protein